MRGDAQSLESIEHQKIIGMNAKQNHCIQMALCKQGQFMVWNVSFTIRFCSITIIHNQIFIKFFNNLAEFWNLKFRVLEKIWKCEKYSNHRILLFFKARLWWILQFCLIFHFPPNQIWDISLTMGVKESSFMSYLWFHTSKIIFYASLSFS